LSVSFPRSVKPGYAQEIDDDDIENDNNNDVPLDSSPQNQSDFLRISQSPEMKMDKKFRYAYNT